MLRRLVLASSSRYRRELLARLGLDFDAEAPDIDERPLPGESVPEMVRRLAAQKAAALVSRHPDALIIGSDQAAELDGQSIGKPGNLPAASAQLLAASGRTLVFHTALCVLDAASGAQRTTEVPTHVAFRTLTAETIARYLAREPAFDCAGSFKSEALGIALCREIASPDPTALVGLPLIALVDLLAEFGMQVPPPLSEN